MQNYSFIAVDLNLNNGSSTISKTVTKNFLTTELDKMDGSLSLVLQAMHKTSQPSAISVSRSFCFTLISSYNSKIIITNWQQRKDLFILCWSGKNQELSQFLLQAKEENNFNKWFVEAFHPPSNSGTLETGGN